MPTRGIASRLKGQAFIIEESADDFTPADGNGFDTALTEGCWFEVDVRPGGSQGDINVTLQHADSDVNAAYAPIDDRLLEIAFTERAKPAQEQVTVSGGGVALDETKVGRHYIGYKGNKRYVRAISSGAAGTPDFAISVGASAALFRRHNH